MVRYVSPHLPSIRKFPRFHHYPWSYGAVFGRCYGRTEAWTKTVGSVWFFSNYSDPEGDFGTIVNAILLRLCDSARKIKERSRCVTIVTKRGRDRSLQTTYPREILRIPIDIRHLPPRRTTKTATRPPDNRADWSVAPLVAFEHRFHPRNCRRHLRMPRERPASGFAST